MEIKSYVFLDLETTGLPFVESNSPKITELCMVSVQADHILLGAIPRVQNKLNLCFNPCKIIFPNIEEITGLSNNLLEDQSTFDDSTIELLVKFLERLQKPVCFVAYNGNRFDYPILKQHIERLKEKFLNNIFCIDSYSAFREILTKNNASISDQEQNKLTKIETKDSSSSSTESELLSDDWDNLLIEEVLKAEKIYELKNKTKRNVDDIRKRNETTPIKNKSDNLVLENKPLKKKNWIEVNGQQKKNVKSTIQRRLNFNNGIRNFKLSSVYEHLLRKAPENIHHAESDVQMMVECAVILGIQFLNWANKNAILFNQVPKLKAIN